MSPYQIILKIICFSLLSTNWICAQTEVPLLNTSYKVRSNQLLFTGYDSTDVTSYTYPQIEGLPNKRMEFEINKFLLSEFLPPVQNIIDQFTFPEEYNEEEYDSEEEEVFWERLNVSFSSNLTSPDLLCIGYGYNREFSGMMHPYWGSRYFNFDLRDTERIEPIENLGILLIENCDSILNQKLALHSEDYAQEDIYISTNSQEEFTIFKNNDSLLWLEIYIPPFADYFAITDGEITAAANGYVPMSFWIPLKEIAAIIAPDYIFLLEE